MRCRNETLIHYEGVTDMNTKDGTGLQWEQNEGGGVANPLVYTRF